MCPIINLKSVSEAEEQAYPEAIIDIPVIGILILCLLRERRKKSSHLFKISYSIKNQLRNVYQLIYRSAYKFHQHSCSSSLKANQLLQNTKKNKTNLLGRECDFC